MADLTPVAAEAGAEGDPRPLYTWAGPWGTGHSLVCSYRPSNGGAPRLVVVAGDDVKLSVLDTGTGAFLGALQGPDPEHDPTSLLTYQRPSDGRPRIASGSNGGHLSIWDGDDLQVIHTLQVDPNQDYVGKLAVYEEPTSGSTRLVTG
jgi:WD40 repeat protein